MNTKDIEEYVEEFRKLYVQIEEVMVRSVLDKYEDWLRTTSEEVRREERERFKEEIDRVLAIQYSGVRPNTDFENGYTTAYKSMKYFLTPTTTDKQ